MREYEFYLQVSPSFSEEEMDTLRRDYGPFLLEVHPGGIRVVDSGLSAELTIDNACDEWEDMLREDFGWHFYVYPGESAEALIEQENFERSLDEVEESRYLERYPNHRI